MIQTFSWSSWHSHQQPVGSRAGGHSPALAPWPLLPKQGSVSIPHCSCLSCQEYLSPARCSCTPVSCVIWGSSALKSFFWYHTKKKEYFKVGHIQTNSSISKMRNTVKFVHFLSNSAQIPGFSCLFSDPFPPLSWECFVSSADPLPPVNPSPVPFLELLWFLPLSYGHKPCFCVQ